MSIPELASVRIVVTGRVQGVFFRRSAAEQARALELKGWARNLSDGSVEIVGEGKRPNLERLLAWAHHGPPLARVETVRVQWGAYEGKFTGFEVR